MQQRNDVIVPGLLLTIILSFCYSAVAAGKLPRYLCMYNYGMIFAIATVAMDMLNVRMVATIRYTEVRNETS